MWRFSLKGKGSFLAVSWLACGHEFFFLVCFQEMCHGSESIHTQEVRSWRRSPEPEQKCSASSNHHKSCTSLASFYIRVRCRVWCRRMLSAHSGAKKGKINREVIGYTPPQWLPGRAWMLGRKATATWAATRTKEANKACKQDIACPVSNQRPCGFNSSCHVVEWH